MIEDNLCVVNWNVALQEPDAAEVEGAITQYVASVRRSR